MPVFHSQDPSFCFGEFLQDKHFTIFYRVLPSYNHIGEEMVAFNQIKFDAKEQFRKFSRKF